mmetsp:Transcript_10599/g.19117  ORF Transcript_10599/g.19117 Transcript_10599/m.19117 type:complete len:159 (-) Transcript_10599:538-1014(-)
MLVFTLRFLGLNSLDETWNEIQNELSKRALLSFKLRSIQRTVELLQQKLKRNQRIYSIEAGVDEQEVCSSDLVMMSLDGISKQVQRSNAIRNAIDFGSFTEMDRQNYYDLENIFRVSVIKSRSFLSSLSTIQEINEDEYEQEFSENVIHHSHPILVGK